MPVVYHTIPPQQASGEDHFDVEWGAERRDLRGGGIEKYYNIKNGPL